MKNLPTYCSVVSGKTVIMLAGLCFLLNTTLRAQDSAQNNEADKKTNSPVRKAAIFTYNRAGEAFNARMRALEDLVTAQIARLGFDIISRELSNNALNEFPGQSGAEGRSLLPGAQLDRILSNNTSSLRLANNLGADYLITASITSFGDTSKEVTAYGNKFSINTSTLRMSYRVAEGRLGGTAISDMVEIKDTIRQTEFEQTIDGDQLNRMMADGAREIGNSLALKLVKHQNRLALDTPGKLANFSVTAVLNGISIPDVFLDEIGNAHVGQKTFPVESVGVTVELDGAAIGSAPGSFVGKPGFHKMRLSREGFNDWERTVNIFDGQTLSIALEFDEKGLQRWNKVSTSIAQLKQDAIITKGEFEMMLGVAQFLKQSGYRVDTNEAPSTKNNNYQSLFSQDLQNPTLP